MGRGILLVLLAAMFWGTSGTASTYAPESADALSIGAIRTIVGALGLLVLALVEGRGRTRPTWPWLLLFIGAVGTAGGQLAFFTAIERAGVAVSTVLTIGVAPVFTGILSAVYLHHRPGRKWAVATALAVIGASIMVLGTAETVGGDPAGLLFGVLGGAGYAIYVTISKKMIDDGHDAVDVTASLFCGAGILMIPVFFLSDWQWVLEPRGTAVALYLGLATNALPNLLFGIGLTMVPVATAATFALLEPLTATMLGVAWLGERLSGLQWFGVALLLVGLLVLAIPEQLRRNFIRSA
ncbi:MAG: EamA family transporter [Thermomicrobiales bacterium]